MSNINIENTVIASWIESQTPTDTFKRIYGEIFQALLEHKRGQATSFSQSIPQVSRDWFKVFALYYAILREQNNIIVFCIEQASTVDHNVETSAADQCTIAVYQALVDRDWKRWDLLSSLSDRLLMICYASKHGSLPLFRFLIKQGASIHPSTIMCPIPGMHNSEVMNVLLGNASQFQDNGPQDICFLQCAAFCGRTDMIDFFPELRSKYQ